MTTAPDKILISGMECLAVIGVSAQERASKQHLYIDVEFPSDGRRAVRTDSITDTVDYDTVAQSVAGVCSSQEYHLIETVAERIAERLLDLFPISEVRVVVRKISPVATPRVAYVSVEIVRTANSSVSS